MPFFIGMKMREDEKKRLCSLTSKIGIALGAGIVYALFVRLTGWGIPCVFYLITDLYCPGCGISRMFLSLLRLDFVAAVRYNLLALCLLPFAIVLFFYKAWHYVKKGNMSMCFMEKVFYSVVFIFCVTFFVLRNTNAVSFLVMP